MSKNWQRISWTESKKIMKTPQKMNSYQRFFLDVDYFAKPVLQKAHKLAAYVAFTFFTFPHLEKDRQKCNWPINMNEHKTFLSITYCTTLNTFVYHVSLAVTLKVYCTRVYISKYSHQNGLTDRIQWALLSLKINVTGTANVLVLYYLIKSGYKIINWCQYCRNN